MPVVCFDGDVAYRALTETDLSSSPDWWEGRTLAQDLWRGDETRSAVALEGGEIVGAGAIWLSRVHDDRFWLEVVVHPAHRRRGVGSGMVRHLASLRCRDLPFAARGYVGDESLRFADALGAKTVQVIPPVRVDLKMRDALRSDSRVQPLAGVDRSRVEAAHADMYRWVHESWSPVRDGFADALNEDLWNEIDVDASSVAVDSAGDILALSLVFVDSDPALVVTETTSRAQPDGELLVEGCVRRSLDRLADRGHARVDFDGHVSDPHFLPTLTRLQPVGRWFRLVEIPADRATLARLARSA